MHTKKNDRERSEESIWRQEAEEEIKKLAKETSSTLDIVQYVTEVSKRKPETR